MDLATATGIPGLQDPSLLRELAFVGGAWTAADDGATVRVTNPANGALIGTVPKMGATETRRAIALASAAMPAWAAKPAKERAAVVRRWSDLMLAHADDLARIMTIEQGKPLAEAKGEVVYAASFLEWFAEEAKRAYGEVIPSPRGDARVITLKQPIGVVAAITPWNFPLAMVTRKAGPGIAVGCPVVLKPAEDTPFSALALAVLAERAGVPAGLFQVVTGDAAEIGGEFCASPTVRKLSFTGSTEVGRLLMRQCADTVKKLSLELGGNAPFIVFDDADLDAAVEGCMASKFRNTGQTCVCANRIFVQAGVHDRFVEKLVAKVRALVVADGLAPGATQGPLISPEALAKVEAHLADALAQGAAIATGGQRHALGGTFFEPTVVTGATPTMACFREESFGPFAPIFRFETDDEAIALANDTEFGLAAYFYANDLRRVWRVAEALEAGMIGINTGIISTEVAPFGGIKQSGLGREGSRHGLDEYLEMKYLMLGGLAPGSGS